MTDIDTTERVHSTGYALKDAKVTVGRDFALDVAGIRLEGKKGDVSNVPRWVGRILADEGLATLDSPDMITELKQALAKEKMVGEYQISALDRYFYIKLKESMSKLGRDDFDRVESMMLGLFRMRRGKLVKMADSIKLNSDLYGRLTVEEAVFYRTIHDNSTAFEAKICAMGAVGVAMHHNGGKNHHDDQWGAHGDVEDDDTDTTTEAPGNAGKDKSSPSQRN